MKTSKYLCYVWVFAVGIALILTYMKFVLYYKELSNTEENFIYIYTDSELPQGIVEECQKYQVGCEIWNIGKGEGLCGKGLIHTAVGYVVCAENGMLKELYLSRGNLSCAVSSGLAYALFGTEDIIGEKIEYQGTLYEVKKLIQDGMPMIFLNEGSMQLEDIEEDDPKKSKEDISGSKLSAAMVKGTKALSYHEIEKLFSDSDFKIDVNLLKWIVYTIVFFFFFCIMLLCCCQNKIWGSKKCFYFVTILIWYLYIKIFIFTNIEEFPVWSLPSKWSDLEGWGNLGEEVLKQISYVVHFKDYPIVCRYYQGLIKSILYLLLSLVLVYLFLKSSLRIRHFWAVHTAMAIIAFAVYVSCSDKDMKMMIYFLPCIAGSLIWKEACRDEPS